MFLVYTENSMCGFIGFVGKTENSKSVLDQMLSAIAHRGPDSQDMYIGEEAALGFRRLSIIDLVTGSQPIFNEDKTKVLVFNGEIYNYKKLREELVKAGHVFTTQTDSEVLIHGYEEYGPKLLGKLRGMFSFVIWDTKAKKMFGARDFFGIKPFYYSTMGEHFLFGSEIKGFLPHPNFKKELNEERLPDYLTFNSLPGNDTFFKNVFKLPPGHYFEYENDVLTITKYFETEFHIEHDKSMDYFADEIALAFSDSVAAHEISDVEVGCFLSSGVDSSYVAKEVSRNGKARTYTIGFDDVRYDESANVKPFAKEIGVENKVKVVSAEDYFGSIGTVQYHLDEPLGNPSATLLYFVSKLAAQDVKVVLSGEGADEVFGGYNIYKEPFAAAGYKKIPLGIRKTFAAIVKPLPDFKGKNFIIRGSQNVEDWYIGNSNVFSPLERQNILKKTYMSRLPQFYTKQWYDKVSGQDDITKMQYLDLHMWMVQEILLKADKMSMAHSLELRVPFLDVEIFKLASRIPVEYKASKENTKLALRRAAGKEINAISANRTKMAFPLPLKEWLREEKYYSLVKGYFSGDSAARFFNQSKIIFLLDEHRSAKKSNAGKIWNIFTFLVWYEEYFIKR